MNNPELKMKKILIMLCLLLFSSLCFPSSFNRTAAKFDSLLTLYSEEGLFNGVVLVAYNTEIIYKKAFGFANMEWKIPMTTDTKFKIGSVSKPFTALLILRLVQEGYLGLDDTIADYLPDYQGPEKSKITISQLLSHTSGIVNSIPANEEKIKERQFHHLEDLKQYTEKAALCFEPGSGFGYSNLGYSLLALIAQRVMQLPFEELLQKQIFNPIHLSNTKNDLDVFIEERLATGYEYDLLGGYTNTTYIDNSYANGAGGITSTVDDLYKWYLALGDDEKLLSDTWKDKMYTPQSTGSYGYGWFIRRKPLRNSEDTLKIIEHSGSINGFGSYFAQIPQDNSVIIVLKNSRSHNYIRPLFAPKIGDQIITIIYDEKLIMPLKSIAMYLGRITGRWGSEKAIEEYYRLKHNKYNDYTFKESELNKLGIELLFKYKRIDDALNIFRLNMYEYPQSYNVYDSYAYTLMQKGDYKNAITAYKKGLQILKKYPEQSNSSIQEYAKNAIKYINEMEIQLVGKSGKN
jgi:CubicO group peptidase (beta-lactamase class C family)